MHARLGGDLQLKRILRQRGFTLPPHHGPFHHQNVDSDRWIFEEFFEKRLLASVPPEISGIKDDIRPPRNSFLVLLSLIWYRLSKLGDTSYM
jgi:hypothetical protein